MILSNKSLTEALSVFIIMLMLIIISTATFTWITRIQDTTITKTNSFTNELERKMTSGIEILDEVYDGKTLHVFIKNNGNNIVPVKNKTSIILYSQNQIICSRDSSRLICPQGCETNLVPGESRRIDILLNEDCDISDYIGIIKYKLDFGGLVGVAAQFEK